MTNKEILQRALAKYGQRRQMRKCQEECAELIVAINHYLENPLNGTVADVYEELADVEIMLNQMSLIFNTRGLVTLFLKRKIERLAEALK